MKLLALLCFVGLVSVSLASTHSGDLDTAPNRSRWMTSLPNSTPLKSLSIPGTHNSFTYSWSAGDVGNPVIPYATCQEDTIENQLKAGVRFLDIRLKMKHTISGRLFRVVHGLFDTSLTSDEVFKKLHAFLDANPNEVILARVQKDSGDATSAEEFHYVWNKLYYPYGGSKKYSKRIHTVSGSLPSLTLGQLRGKIVLLCESWGADSTTKPGTTINYGYQYTFNSVIQDNYVVNTSEDMDRKFSETVAAVQAASTSTLNKLHITYTSANIGNANGFFRELSPKSIAEGLLTMDGRFITGQNERTMNFLVAPSPPLQKTGVIMMDYPGAGLVNAILAYN